MWDSPLLPTMQKHGSSSDGVLAHPPTLVSLPVLVSELSGHKRNCCFTVVGSCEPEFHSWTVPIPSNSPTQNAIEKYFPAQFSTWNNFIIQQVIFHSTLLYGTHKNKQHREEFHFHCHPGAIWCTLHPSQFPAQPGINWFSAPGFLSGSNDTHWTESNIQSLYHTSKPGYR